MAIGTKKEFRQNIFGADVLGVDPANGTVEICVLCGTQASPEDKAAFLKELGSCFREAYSWTAAQFGMEGAGDAAAAVSDTYSTQKADTSALDVIGEANFLLRQACKNFKKAQALLGAKTISPVEAIKIFNSLGITAVLVDSLGTVGSTMLKEIDGQLPRETEQKE